MTKETAPVTVILQFPVTSALVPVGVATYLVPLARAPLVLAEQVRNEVAESSSAKRPPSPKQDAECSLFDSFDNSFSSDALLDINRPSETSHVVNHAELSLPAEAIPTDRQPKRRFLRMNLHTLCFCETLLKRKGNFLQTGRFQLALIDSNG